MPELKAIYDSEDSIPETVEDFRKLFTEKNGKWELTGIGGIKTQADVTRQQGALEKERDAHKATKEKLSGWGDLEPDDVHKKLDRIPELEAAAGDKLDDSAIDDLANKRAEAMLKTRVGPLERDLKKTVKERDELLDSNTAFKAADVRRTIHDGTRRALTSAKVLPEAHEDALMLAERVFEVTEEGSVLTRDGVGVTPGLDPTSWLSEIQDKRPHWWPGSVGGGARGSGAGGAPGGKNPWTHEGWNMTEQGALLRSKGQDHADRMAAAAGTTVGGSRPTPKGS